MIVGVGQRGGKFTRRLAVQTNDPQNRTFNVQAIANVRAALVINPPQVNFGQIERDSDAITRTIELKKGDAGPIAPKIMSAGRGVTAELREIEAGEHYELTVTASPPWPNRMLRSSIIVQTGVEKSPRESIVVYGRVPQRLAAVPQRLTIPGNLTQDTTLRARLVWHGGDPGKVLSVRTNHPELTAEIEARGAHQYVTLEVPQDFDSRGRRSFAIFLQTDDDQAKQMTIPVVQAGHVRTPTRATSRPPVRRGQLREINPQAPRGGTGTGGGADRR